MCTVILLHFYRVINSSPFLSYYFPAFLSTQSSLPTFVSNYHFHIPNPAVYQGYIYNHRHTPHFPLPTCSFNISPPLFPAPHSSLRQAIGQFLQALFISQPSLDCLSSRCRAQ
jgi:hypothetical protein